MMTEIKTTLKTKKKSKIITNRKMVEMVRIDPSEEYTCIYHSSNGIRLYMPTKLLVDIPNDVRIGIQNGVLGEAVAELENKMRIIFRILDETQKYRAYINKHRKIKFSEEEIYDEE